MSAFDKNRGPMVLDVVGCHREVTLCGHIDLIESIPIHHSQHLHLLEQYRRHPGNYQGRYSDYHKAPATLLDYGSGYVAIKLYDDISRPEMGELLLSKGWKLIGYATNQESGKSYILEKWCNIRDH